MWLPPPFSSPGKGVLFIFSTELALSSKPHPLALGKQCGRGTTIEASSKEAFQYRIYATSEPLRCTADPHRYLGGLLFGYDTAVINGAVDSLKTYFIDPRFADLTSPAQANVANALLGFVVSSTLIGSILGGLMGGWVNTHVGRKRGLIIASLLFPDFCIGRFCTRVPLCSERSRWAEVHGELCLLSRPRRYRRGVSVHAVADVYRGNRATQG